MQSQKPAPENSGLKHDGRFRPGLSGNPAGKPKGARNKTTLMIEGLMQDGAKAIVDAVITAAQRGDLTAARLVLDRISPPRKDAPIVDLQLPALETAADAIKAMALVIEAVTEGLISPSEASSVTALIETFLRSIETAEFERRLAALEEASK